jgi:hypothetical protein
MSGINSNSTDELALTKRKETKESDSTTINILTHQTSESESVYQSATSNSSSEAKLASEAKPASNSSAAANPQLAPVYHLAKSPSKQVTSKANTRITSNNTYNVMVHNPIQQTSNGYNILRHKQETVIQSNPNKKHSPEPPKQKPFIHNNILKYNNDRIKQSKIRTDMIKFINTNNYLTNKNHNQKIKIIMDLIKNRDSKEITNNELKSRLLREIDALNR